jgi:F0F1-type ATP synthase epsilon subunit
MSRKIKINPSTTYQFIQVFNGILELTDKEMQVLASFIDLSTTINLCSASNKRAVAEVMGIKEANTLNIYVKRLKDKGAIVKTKNGYRVSKLLEENKVIIEIEKQ